ncbi:metallophosphoesterase [Paenibacillus sp. GCM10027627]|uniref:metallophosphoesterase n=1 Tax=unclassified Paenibacillus TaxID=185978 RepID=UPI00363E0C6E
MIIETKIHTIFMLVGPSECGKSTFAQEVLLPQLKMYNEGANARTNVQYLASDAIRQELLGYPYDKYDQVMLESSSHAFQLLFDRLKLATSFPINAEFVILDTTGLAEDFRAKVREAAHMNNYNVEVVLFDYRRREDYYHSERSKKLISNHITRMKKDVLPVISREGYENIHKVRAKDFIHADTGLRNPDYSVKVTDWEAYLSTHLSRDYKYIIVGDVHECVAELQGLLLTYGFKVESGKLIASEQLKNTKIVLAGDWIDKGKRTREIIEFLHDNKDHFLFVTGNHENFVYKYLHGDIKGAESEIIQNYFDSIEVLEGDAELRGKFYELAELAKPFYRFNGVYGPSYYVTHAPCKNKYIGKLDANSVRHQRRFRLDRDESAEQQLSFLKEEAVSNHPFHFFGHIAAKKAFRLKNKIHLDTGCVHGNLLSAATVTFKPFIKSFRSLAAAVEEPLHVLFHEEKKVTLRELDEDAIKRLRYSTRHKINYISGTMSPADKDMEGGELESLAKGLDYFRERGIFDVVLQPKYMGSRCNLYLSRDADRCYAVSRNGYKIKAVDMAPIYETLLAKFGGYMEESGIDTLILDGELLPWKALGEGLIERQFKPIEKALETELSFLKEYGFDGALTALFEQYDSSGFEKDQHTMPKAELSNKYGMSVYQNYKNVKEIQGAYIPTEQHEEAHRMYKQQMELYAGDGEATYKPFAILKEVLENGEERLPEGRTSEMYGFLSDDEYLVLHLHEGDAYKRAEQFFRTLTVEQGMEGVVIKPEYESPGAVPFLKVRNEGYLSIIYGYDYRFPHKYSKLIKQKQIASKLRTSLSEHRLGKSMLEVKLRDISPDNEQYKQITANLLFEVAKEKEIDPRL